MSLELFKEITSSGLRVFSLEEACFVAANARMHDKKHVVQALHHLKNKELILRIKNGLYVVNHQFLSGSPLHEYEIAMHLANPAAVCCFSAMQYHNLTDQTSRIIYLMTTWGGDHSKLSKTHYNIFGTKYYFIRSKPELYFGITKQCLSDIAFNITDLERTLVDALLRPKYCGGMRETIAAFELAQDRIDIEKIISYARKFGVTVCKRLGYILERLNIENNLILELKDMPLKEFCKLDPSRARVGRYNKEWMILENI